MPLVLKVWSKPRIISSLNWKDTLMYQKMPLFILMEEDCRLIYHWPTISALSSSELFQLALRLNLLRLLYNYTIIIILLYTLNMIWYYYTFRLFLILDQVISGFLSENVTLVLITISLSRKNLHRLSKRPKTVYSKLIILRQAC